MLAQFWLNAWKNGKTRFHRQAPMDQLKMFGTSRLPQHSKVLVPLCGKSTDMDWLLEQGYRVLGVELSPIAVEQFFAERNLEPEVYDTPYGKHYFSSNLEIINGDIFDIDKSLIKRCGAVYDRAALVALPPGLQKSYVEEIYGNLPIGARGLMLTVEYKQHLMDGPPFSVDAQTLRSLFGKRWQVSEIEQVDILDQESHFRREHGLDSFYSNVFGLIKTQ